jgi:hypothetical protein
VEDEVILMYYSRLVSGTFQADIWQVLRMYVLQYYCTYNIGLGDNNALNNGTHDLLIRNTGI